MWLDQRPELLQDESLQDVNLGVTRTLCLRQRNNAGCLLHHRDPLQVLENATELDGTSLPGWSFTSCLLTSSGVMFTVEVAG